VNRIAGDWEFLLWDTDPTPSPSRVPVAPRLVAAARTARGLRVLRRHGWGTAQCYLRDLRPAAEARAELTPRMALRLARREVLPCHLVLRLVEPNALCLPRSFALVTYLSTFGLPAEVVVARQRSSIGRRFAFHAWAELHGEVLGDIPGVTVGYTALQRARCTRLQPPHAAQGRLP
jgi:hypothetical protein